VTVIPAEAAVTREAAGRVLAGESALSLARDPYGRGITTVTGRAWTAEGLRKVLASARLSGRRERHGVIMSEMSWPPVIGPGESDELRVMLARSPGTPAQRPDSTCSRGSSRARRAARGCTAGRARPDGCGRCA
jgi:site-specific DNA recombinase